MRRPVWIIGVLLILGLWLWVQHDQRAPAQAPAATSQAARPSMSPFSPLSSEPESRRSATEAARTTPAYPAFLPPEAHGVLDRIARGGPFEYRQDGGVFQNRERRLPSQPRGYYREYTVETPDAPDRGARRIITGGEPPREYWYTEDHYRSFRRFEVSP